MTLEEIKLRQLSGQHLLAPVDCVQAAQDLCGFQAQFLSHALHALRLRTTACATDALVKTWTLRGTMHLFAKTDLPLMLHEGRKPFLRPCDTMETDAQATAQRKRYFAELIVDSIRRNNGEREALKQVCTAHGMTETEAQSLFNPWGGVLRALCESGVICHCVQEKKAFQLCPPFEPMSKEMAEMELARRYFLHYGPATAHDAAYFFGARQSDVQKWMSALPLCHAVVQGRTYHWIDSGAVDIGELPEWLFLAGFDPLMQGYQKQESLYLPAEYLRGIFSLSGIVSPAVLWNGRVIGKWKRSGKRLDVQLFEEKNAAERERIVQTAHGMGTEIRSVRFVP